VRNALRVDRLLRVVLLAAESLSLSGCPNPNAYTVPRTLEPGDLQLLGAAEVYAFTDRVTTSSGTSASTSRTTGATPLFPTLGVRYGLLDGLDFGARIENFETLAGDLKIRLLRGKLDIAELSTPITTRHFMNYQRGEAYGVSATPARFGLRCLTPHTSVRDLYLTGQDVCTLGVTGAMMGGVLTASAVLGRNLVSVVSKPDRRAQIAA